MKRGAAGSAGGRRVLTGSNIMSPGIAHRRGAAEDVKSIRIASAGAEFHPVAPIQTLPHD
jgi:predicted ribosome-associated RNA-binding protein Tma20